MAKALTHPRRVQLGPIHRAAAGHPNSGQGHVSVVDPGRLLEQHQRGAVRSSTLAPSVPWPGSLHRPQLRSGESYPFGLGGLLQDGRLNRHAPAADGIREHAPPILQVHVCSTREVSDKVPPNCLR